VLVLCQPTQKEIVRFDLYILIMGVCHMGQFDGEGFSELIVIIILVVLFFYGSNNIETLTGAPTSDN
jgi:hypothetical protein